jgi:hypothetical protein
MEMGQFFSIIMTFGLLPDEVDAFLTEHYPDIRDMDREDET